MASRFIPITVEVNDSKGTPKVKQLKSAFDDVEKSGTKASSGLKSVFDSIGRFAGQAAQKAENSLKQIPAAVVKVGSEVKNVLSQIKQQFQSTARESSSAFSDHFNAAFLAGILQQMLNRLVQFGKDFVGKSVELAQEAKSAFLGLESVAVFKGVDSQQAQAAVNNLRLVQAGIISATDASVALRNILQKGFGLEESIKILEIFSDTMAFGKQAALSYGEAIRSGSEGLKNDNAILLDNIGLSKNQSVILKERGFALEDLADKSKGAAARQALLNGLIAESQGQLGDATKLTQTYTGVVAAQDKAYQDLQRTIGELIITNPALLESNKIVTEQINAGTKAIQDQNSESAKFANDAIRYWAKIKANLVPIGALVVNLTTGVLASVGILINASVGSILKVTEFLVDSVKRAVSSVINLFVDGINKLTSLARTLPSVPGSPIDLLKAVPELQRVDTGETNLGSKVVFDTLKIAIKDFNDSFRGVIKAFNEATEISRRIDSAVAPSTATETRSNRANSLLNDVLSGGSGKAKKVADDFRSIANAVPVPVPSDPQLKAMIEEYAGTFGIPTWVAFAQIWTESRFNKNALSNKGAKGLTQIMPGTAAQYGVSYNKLGDPATALSGWGKIMSSLYNKYGSWDLALLAYHQGEKPVDRLVSIIQRGEVNEAAGGFAAAAKRAGIGPAGRKYLEDINLFKSNPVPTAESPFQGMTPQQIVNAVLNTDARGNARAITTSSAPLAQLSVKADRQWENYYKTAEARAQELNDRREDLDAAYFEHYTDLTTQLGHLELDLQQIRRTAADDQFTDQRRLFKARSEEKDLLLSIRDVQDEIANGPYNDSLRIQLALLEDIADIRRRDEDAIKSQNRAKLELADADVFHAQQARAIVLGRLAETRGATEVFADAIVDSYDAINEAVFRGVERLTGGVRILDNLLAGIINRITNRLFQKLLDVLIPPGGSTASAGAGGGGLLSFFRPSTGGSTAAKLGNGLFGGFGGASGAGQLSGSGLFGVGGLTAPTSLTSQLAQQAAFSGVIQQASASGGLGAAAAGALAPKAPGIVGSIGAMLPFLGLGLGVQAGGQSRLGSILGGAGGLIAGGIGAAFLAPGIFAAGGLFGGMGPAIAGLLTNPFTAVAAGALIVGALIFGKTAARRRDETTRNKAMVDSLAQLNELLNAVRHNRMDGQSAITAALSIRSQYVEAMSALKDSKTRRIALSDVSRLDAVIAQIRGQADLQVRRRETEARIVPEFASGGSFKSDYFVPKAARGLLSIPGVFDRRDDMLMRVSRGEHVAVMTPQQYARIGGRDTFTAAGVPSFDGGGFFFTQQPAPAPAARPAVFSRPVAETAGTWSMAPAGHAGEREEVHIYLHGIDPAQVVHTGLKDPKNKRLILHINNENDEFHQEF